MYEILFRSYLEVYASVSTTGLSSFVNIVHRYDTRCTKHIISISCCECPQ